MKILVGADPELFIRNPKTGMFVSAHDLLPGTKAEPFPVPSGAIQVDGVAAEFNITPSETADHFVTNINQVLNNLKTRTAGFDLVLDPCAVFDMSYFKSLPEQTRELGCNPDFNAWTGKVNPSPEGEETSMRTASGHIHIGWCKDVNPQDPIHFEDCCAVVKQLDYYLGLYSLLWDRDTKRRSLYGMAGAFRPKTYGAEYRVLSNVWVRNPSVQVWIFNAIQKAVFDLSKKDRSLTDNFKDYARKCINNNEKWWSTPTGMKVHQTTGLQWPEWKSWYYAGDEAKEQEKSPTKEEIEYEFWKNKKKKMPHHTYAAQ